MPKRRQFQGTLPAKPTDSPEPTIMIKQLVIDVHEHVVEASVKFIPFVRGVARLPERRAKLFDLNTPFIDILEDVPNIYKTWKDASRVNPRRNS